MVDGTLVTIHGFWSSPATWDRLKAIWQEEEQLHGLRIHPFGYASPKKPRLPFSPTRVPDYDDIAETLATEYMVALAQADNIVIVTHSQGGLIAQRFLAWMLREGRGRELSRIRSVIMLACPNGGSEYLGSLRHVLGYGRHPQASDLEVLKRRIADTQRTVLRQIVNATDVDDHQCRIPFHVYAGDSDQVVTAASAQAGFPGASTLAGNHFSILNPASPGNRTAETVKHHIITDLPDGSAQRQPPRASNTGRPALGPVPDTDKPTPATDRRPAVTDRWCYTSDGGKVPALMAMTHTSMFHPGYAARQTQDEPPSVKIGMLVACNPIDPSSSGSELRARFVAFLDSAAVRQIIGALTHVEPGMSWKNLAGHGPRTLEAALTAGEDPMEGVPIASALFLPPTAGESLYGRNSRSATLVLYVEPRTADGHVPPASDLTGWHRRFNFALAVPGAFADFIAKDLGLGAFDNPPAQLGIWLKSNQPLTSMIDTQGLRALPGSWPSNEFMGWAFADRDGKSIAETTRDLLIQLCEYTLHLDGFEQKLAEATDSMPSEADLAAGDAGPESDGRGGNGSSGMTRLAPGAPGENELHAAVARADRSVSAAADLLNTLYAAKDVLRLLPYTEAAAGSPLSYGERGDRARPMLDDLRRAAFVKVPLLTDRELARRFRLFLTICEYTASTSVDASEVHQAVKEARAYADHLHSCLVAHIDETPLPASPALTITAKAAEQQAIVASVTKPGQVVTRDNEAV